MTYPGPGPSTGTPSPAEPCPGISPNVSSVSSPQAVSPTAARPPEHFAENSINPAPEVVVDSIANAELRAAAPAASRSHSTTTRHGSAATGSSVVGGDGTGDGRSVRFAKYEGGGIDGFSNGPIVWPPRDKPWYRRVPSRKKMSWITASVIFLGCLIIMLAILGAFGILKGNQSFVDSPTSSFSQASLPSLTRGSGLRTDTSSTSTASSSTVPTSSTTTKVTATPTDGSTSSTSSSTSSSGTSSSAVPDCSNSASFTPNVSWVGLAGADKWSSTYSHPGSPQGCCSNCLAKPGCGAWLFNRTDPYTQCALVVIDLTTDGPAADSACPKGYAADSIFSQDAVGTLAGPGPCCKAFTGVDSRLALGP